MVAVTSTTTDSHRDLLGRVERYYDAVPRSAARAEEFGPLTLFVREGAGWPYYARPALGWSAAAATADDVRRVLARQRELGLPQSFEWVAETTPGLRAAVEQAGLVVHEHPLLALPADAQLPAVPEPAAGVSVRTLDAEDEALPSALALTHLAFAEPGTALGTAGPAELAAAVRVASGDGTVEVARARIRSGLTRVAAAVADGSALCSGRHQPVGPVSEVVAVGTLPTARRRGLALAVTAVLVADARALGVRTVFLSADDEAVARVYARIGFRPVATALIAEPPA